MPSKCSLLNCGASKSVHQLNLTFHRLPRNEKRKEIWLEAIGKENLSRNTKDIHICSLHFNENSFNKTLDILRLKYDAVPCLFLTSHSTDQCQPSTSSNTDYPKGCQADIHLSHSSDQCQPSTSSNTDYPKGCQADIHLNKVIIQVNDLKDQVTSQKRKIKCLNETVRRQKIKLGTYQEIINDLKQRNLVTHENCILLEQCAGPKDFLLRQISKVKGFPLERQYSKEIRKFAVTLHFFSPRAYDFVRSEYDSCLPHPRTLCKWYQNVDAEPGFCKEAFDVLQATLVGSDVPVVCALIFDEMSIRKSLCWDSKSQKYYGRVNMGFGDESDSSVANQALVFLVNCINGKWKLPVAYFLITSLGGEQKASLVQTCIQKCQDTGIKIVSVTCDGPAANFSMFGHLGCDLFSQQKETSFINNNEIVHCFIYSPIV